MSLPNPYWSNGVADLYQCDSRSVPLADQSVHCIVVMVDLSEGYLQQGIARLTREPLPLRI